MKDFVLTVVVPLPSYHLELPKGDSPLHQFRPRGRSELVRACARKRMHKFFSVRFGARGHAMGVENISTSIACPRPPKRTESLMLSQVRSARAGETSVMENRLYETSQKTSPALRPPALPSP